MRHTFAWQKKNKNKKQTCVIKTKHVQLEFHNKSNKTSIKTEFNDLEISQAHMSLPIGDETYIVLPYHEKYQLNLTLVAEYSQEEIEFFVVSGSCSHVASGMEAVES